MNEQEVVDLMRSSKSEEEWNQNCDRVQAVCDGYPSFWYSAIIVSGVAQETSAKWGGTDQIQLH